MTATGSTTRLAIVIVCYRAADLTIDCLHTLAPEIESAPGTKVFICENGTGEASARKIADAIEREGWQEWAHLEVITDNCGFTGGNNVILRQLMAWPTPPPYIILLNADTLVRPGALRGLLEAAEARPDAGIIGPTIEYPDGRPQNSFYRYANPMSEFLRAACTGPLTRLFHRYDLQIDRPDEPIEVDWVSFDCAIIRSEVFAQVGLLDEGFFLYFDDPDFCRRAARSGWKIVHWPGPRVAHLLGQSNPTESNKREHKRRPRYYYQARTRFLAKYYGRSGLFLANILWHLGRCISLTRRVFGHKGGRVCKAEAIDIWTNFWRPMKTDH